METEEAMTMFPIMSLPQEVRGRIFNFLVQKEAMGLRRVCRQWQEEIHTYYNYHLQLDENNPHLQNILDRQRITDCTTGQFLLTPPKRARIFKHANLIQSLIISVAKNWRNENFAIAPDNLQVLLIECGKSLKRLEIHFTNPLLRYEYPQTQFNFPNLRSLMVIVCPCSHTEVPSLQAHVDQEVRMINRLIRDSFKPKLVSVSVKLYYHTPSQADWYSSTILSTAANHSKTLREIRLDFQKSGIQGWDRITFPPYQLGQKDWARIRKVADLSHLNIRYNDYEDAASVGAIGLGWMAELVMTQKKLKRLKIVVKKFEWVVLQEICLNCFGSLVDIEVQFTHCTIKTFDASCFKDCRNLKNLLLERQTYFERGIHDSYNIVNFHLLPESIMFVSIESISILTTELEGISSSGFKNLIRFELVKCGLSGLHGVDLEVVQKLILLPELRSLIVLDFNFSDYDEEAKFTALSQSLIPTGTIFGDSWFQRELERRNDEIFMVVRGSPLDQFIRI